MLSLDERIAKSKEKVQQLERQRRAQKKAEQERQRKMDTRRNTLVGEIFIKHFPYVTKLSPCMTEADNNTEFSVLEDFFSALAADNSWSELLKAEIYKKNLPES